MPFENFSRIIPLMPSVKIEIRKIKISDKEYPPLLKEITNPPKEFFVRGVLPEKDKIFVAIVGTRKATSEGRVLAKKIGKLCAAKGWVVVSGLAMGIDTAAHEGALEGGGETVAVLGCGADCIYPAQNENLSKKIEQHGAIISEYTNGTPALPHRFLERNRIVAGLSIATIVIEAPAHSGAIVTARLASESGREVFVFPGLAGHPQYRGSHSLIRDGARLVNSFEDILEDLGPILSSSASAHTSQFSDLERESKKNKLVGDFLRSGNDERQNYVASPLPIGEGRAKRVLASGNFAARHGEAKENITGDADLILSILSKSKTPLSVDKISELTHLSPQAVNSELGEMMINHIIEEDGLGYKIKLKP